MSESALSDTRIAHSSASSTDGRDGAHAGDLRSFIAYLDEHSPNEVLRLDLSAKDFSLAECDAGALLTKLRQSSQKPLLLMDGPMVYDGSTWPGSVLFSELSTRLRESVALGFSREEGFEVLAQEWLRRSQAAVDPIEVRREDAPVMQNVWTGDEASLHRLPIYRKDEFDARPGWLCGIAIARHPESGRYNLSWHRLHARAPEWAPMRINPRHLNAYMQSYREMGAEQMPVAIAFGHHPMFELCAASPCGWELDEYRFAGGLMGEPLRVVASESFGADLLVPAGAEVIVEGHVDLANRELCGPWADFMQYYSPQTLEPVFRPTAVTFRDQPIFVENWTSREALGSLGATPHMYSLIQQRFPSVKSIASVAPFTYVIQTAPGRPGETTRLAAFFVGSFADHVKNVILVDEDVDPWDLDAVMFSIATRVNAETAQVQVMRGLAGNRHDPATEPDARVGGLIIDSTKPAGKAFPPLGKPPEEALRRVSLEALGL